MNDHELESRLRSVHLPERSEDYWDDFPARVRVQLRRSDSVPLPQSVRGRRLRLAGTFAMAIGLMWFGERFHPIETASNVITRQSHVVMAEVVQLQKGLSLVAFNPHGMGYLLGDAN